MVKEDGYYWIAQPHTGQRRVVRVRNGKVNFFSDVEYAFSELIGVVFTSKIGEVGEPHSETDKALRMVSSKLGSLILDIQTRAYMSVRDSLYLDKDLKELTTLVDSLLKN